MATREEVIWAYRMLLGRDPESEIIIQGHTEKALPNLRTLILQSEEFRLWGGAAAFETAKNSLEDPRIDVDVVVPTELLSRMIARVEQNFSYMGQTEPYWSVITADKFLMSNIDKHREEFLLSGKETTRDLRAALERCNIKANHFKSCLELGCGLGRTTIWLAEMFSHVFAADISAAHLKAAQEALREQGRTNVSFLLSDDIASYESFPRFDVFFSIIVLQHNPPPLIAHILRTLLRKLNPGGVGYFQVPTYHAAYRFKADEYLARGLQPGVPEMHVLPQMHLFGLLSELGCDIVESREDTIAGSGWLSNRLLVQKLQSRD